MSATIETDRVAAFLGHCPLVISEGRLHPVDIRYEPRAPDQPWPVAIARAVERLLKQTAGDVLAFLPGMGEIRAAQRELEPLAAIAPVGVQDHRCGGLDVVGRHRPDLDHGARG